MMRMYSGGIASGMRLPAFCWAEGGATAVEFAITAPIFLTFLYGILELGRAILALGMMTYAVQEGSRYASAHTASSVAQIKSVVMNSFVGIDTGPVTLAVIPTAMPDGTTVVRLDATYNFQPLVPILGVAPINLNASSSGWR